MAKILRIIPRYWSPRGEAMGSLRGKPVMVWGGIPDEKAEAKLTRMGHNRDYAVWVGSPEPSVQRVEPSCPKYSACGGCPMMHLSEQGQHDARRRMVVSALNDEGLNDVKVGKVHPSPDGNTDFRHVVKLGVGFSEQGSLRVGAWGRHDRSIVPIPMCEVATPDLRTLMGHIAHNVREYRLGPYDPQNDRGVLRAFVLRQSRSTGDIHITISAGRRPRVLQEFADDVARMNKVSGVSLHLNSEPGNAIFSRDEEGNIPMRLLAGTPYIEEELLGVTYRIGPGDFFQTNPAMAEELYRHTLNKLELKHGQSFVDLYAGVGGMALAASRVTGYALGVEGIAGAVASARDTARRQKLPAEFMVGWVQDVLPDLKERLQGMRPVVVVNPARRGLEADVIDSLHALAPSKVAYVSCNPKALARDLVKFKELGYRIGQVELFDMFPNTAHVESVVVLESGQDSEPSRRAPRRRVIGGRR